MDRGPETESGPDGWVMGALLLGFLLGHFFTIYSVMTPLGQ